MCPGSRGSRRRNSLTLTFGQGTMEASVLTESQMSLGATRPLQGQRALVTGASSGIGASVARALGRAGASVDVNYVVDPEAADAVVAQDVRETGGEAMIRRVAGLTRPPLGAHRRPRG